MLRAATVRVQRGAQVRRGLRGRRRRELPRGAGPRRLRARAEHRAHGAAEERLADHRARHARRAHRGTLSTYIRAMCKVGRIVIHSCLDYIEILLIL